MGKPAERLVVEHMEPEEEQRRELEGRNRERVHPDPAMRAEVAAIETRLAESVQHGNAAAVHAEVKRQITSDPVAIPDAGVAEETPSPALEDMKQAKKQADEKVGKADDKSTEWAGARYLGIATTVVAVGASAVLIIEYLARLLRKDPSPGADLPPLDPDMVKALQKLADDWRARKPSDYWTLFADEVAQNPATYTLGDQLVFMNITVKIGGSSGGFIWDSAADEADKVAEMVKAYHDGGDSAAAMYRAAAKAQYSNADIPIVIMAEVLGLAFAWLGVKAAALPEPQGA